MDENEFLFLLYPILFLMYCLLIIYPFPNFNTVAA